jgi:hypothetical protein
LASLFIRTCGTGRCEKLSQSCPGTARVAAELLDEAHRVRRRPIALQRAARLELTARSSG